MRTPILALLAVSALSTSASPFLSVNGSSVAGPPGGFLEFVWTANSFPFSGEEHSLGSFPATVADIGNTYVIDSTSPAFAPFVEKVTDGINNFIDVRYLGPAGAASEAQFFWGNPAAAIPDLAGHNIDHFELHIRNATHVFIPPIGLDIGSADWTFSVFEKTSSLPEAGSSIGLFVLGLSALGFLRGCVHSKAVLSWTRGL